MTKELAEAAKALAQADLSGCCGPRRRRRGAMPEAPPTRAALILAMAEAYCQTSGEGGGKLRYVKAMERVLTAIEAAGCRVVPIYANARMAQAASDYEDDPHWDAVWIAMIHASPYAPEAEG